MSIKYGFLYAIILMVNQNYNKRKNMNNNYKINTKMIESYMQKHNLDVEKMAKLCGFEKEELTIILENRPKYKLHQIVRLSRIIGVEYENMFIFK